MRDQMDSFFYHHHYLVCAAGSIDQSFKFIAQTVFFVIKSYRNVFFIIIIFFNL
jgi:hypothetical protein